MLPSSPWWPVDAFPAADAAIAKQSREKDPKAKGDSRQYNLLRGAAKCANLKPLFDPSSQRFRICPSFTSSLIFCFTRETITLNALSYFHFGGYIWFITLS